MHFHERRSGVEMSCKFCWPSLLQQNFPMIRFFNAWKDSVSGRKNATQQSVCLPVHPFNGSEVSDFLTTIVSLQNMHLQIDEMMLGGHLVKEFILQICGCRWDLGSTKQTQQSQPCNGWGQILLTPQLSHLHLQT